ncbi:exodeoxyribonuclease VII large subunit [Holophaga foetida]|uniref:exodeoxyribonuclease VII large subunit n=1 Tax=Holophaga foetida TaxID=35839 RepID=UPI0002473B5A|nr:exodeoxyribonuclease VII large subunit [Holophaga foetida]
MSEAPLSVKVFLERVKDLVEKPFAGVCVEGEVSNFRGSGRHWYFTLKEEGASIQCAVWASQQRFLKHTPKDGERIVVIGNLNLYVAGGSLTFAVTQVQLAGLGDLQARLRQLEAELRRRGLFDRPKRAIPRFPKRIGVVAAQGGAALRDVLEVCARRAPGLDLLIAPAAAQGERCVPENLMALQEIQDEFWGCDLVLLVRGGGSLEDLWAYNDPALVEAVATCRLPIITGVGHEIDTTLVDLASDRRAATPSQAAELATPDRQQLASELARRVDALHGRMAWRMQGFETTLNLLVDHGLMRCEPVVVASQRMETLGRRLEDAQPLRRLERAAGRWALLNQRLMHAAAGVSGEGDRPRWVEASRRLAPAAERVLADRRERLSVLGARLEGLNPTGPLSRGFVLVKDGEGRPVLSAKALPDGAEAALLWADGERRAKLD